MKDLRHKLIRKGARARFWTRRNVPAGLRLPAGLLLMVGGVFGALPILGFWMFPLGIMVAALDVGPAMRWTRTRLGGVRRHWTAEETGKKIGDDPLKDEERP